ncbi:hypothetical protein DUI87_02290 [Hirundo rustica rustica]|uniref:ribonuclease H n=1 Tax=Hirundo rustica rustica TaxID=333673 RepID=A0A3M0LBW4_HIRRU|nr:hypothetical protein DUI87_02290 [Hirundo rustica rustica]
MKNSPVICQWYVASLLSPVRAAAGQAIIYHYMDDVLVCAPNDDMLSHVLGLTVDALVAAGFELQEEKVQRMPPWKYLGLEIGRRTIVPQKLAIRTKVSIRPLSDTSARARCLGSKNDLRSWSEILGLEGQKGHTIWSRGDVVNHVTMPSEEDHEEEGLELEEVLEGIPEDEEEIWMKKSMNWGTQRSITDLPPPFQSHSS